MSVSGFSVEQDREIAGFKSLQLAVYASEIQRKERQRQARAMMGLPDLGGM